MRKIKYKKFMARVIPLALLLLSFCVVSVDIAFAGTSSGGGKKGRSGNLGKKELKELYNGQSRAAMVTYTPNPSLLISGSQTNLGAMSAYLKNKYASYNADSIEIDGITLTEDELYSMVEAAVWLAINSGNDPEAVFESMYADGLITEEMWPGDDSDTQCDSWECEDAKKGAKSEAQKKAILAIVRNAIRQADEDTRKDDEEKYADAGSLGGAYIVVSGKNRAGGKQVLSVVEAKSAEKAKEDGEAPSGEVGASIKRGAEEAQKEDEKSYEDEASIKSGESYLKNTSISKTSSKKKDKYAKETEYETKDTKPILIPVTEAEYRECTSKGAAGKQVGDKYYLYAKLPVDKLAGEAKERNVDGTPASMGITEGIVEGLLVMTGEDEGEAGEGKENKATKGKSVPLTIKIALKSLMEKKEAKDSRAAQAEKSDSSKPPSVTGKAKSEKKTASASGAASETISGAAATGASIARGTDSAESSDSSTAKRGNITRRGSEDDVKAAARNGTLVASSTRKNADGTYTYTQQVSNPQDYEVNSRRKGSFDDVVASGRQGRLVNYYRDPEGQGWIIEEHITPVRSFVSAGTGQGEAASEGIVLSTTRGVAVARAGANSTFTRQGVREEEYQSLKDQGKLAGAIQLADGTYNIIERDKPLGQASSEGVAGSVAKGINVGQDALLAKGSERKILTPEEFQEASKEGRVAIASQPNADGNIPVILSAPSAGRMPRDTSKTIGVGQDALLAKGSERKILTPEEFQEASKEGRVAIASQPNADGNIPVILSAPSAGRMPREPQGIRTGEQVASVQTRSPTRFSYRGSREEASAAAKRGTLIAAQDDGSGGLLITEDMAREKQVAVNPPTSTRPAVAATATPVTRTVVIDRNVQNPSRAAATAATGNQGAVITGVPSDKNVNMRATDAQVAAAKARGIYVDSVKNYDGTNTLTTSTRGPAVPVVSGVPSDKNINLRATYRDVIAAQRSGTYIDAVRNYDGTYSLTTKKKDEGRI